MISVVFVVLVLIVIAPPQVDADTLLNSGLEWKASRALGSDWNNQVLNDSLWLVPIFPTRGSCSYFPDPIFFAQPMWPPQAKEKETVYFRSAFVLDKPVQSAILKVGFDDDGEVFVNGELVMADYSGRTEKTAIMQEIAEHLVVGQNVVAMKVVDSFGGCQWAQAQLDIEYASATLLDVPLIKQNDPTWGAASYAGGIVDALTCGSTIAQCGCALTSIAMALSFHAVETTPPELNDYFLKNQRCTKDGCVSRGYVYGAVRWNAANAYALEQHNAHGSPKVQYVPNSSSSAEVIAGDIDNNNPVILRAPQESHWFVARGYSESDTYIRDPLFDRSVLSDPAYMGAFGALRRYEKVNSDFSLIEAFTRSNAHLLLTDVHGRQTGYDPMSGSIKNDIPSSSYQFEQFPESDDGVWWLLVSRPVDGVYTLQSSEDAATVLYASTRDGKETMFSDVLPVVKIQYSDESGAKIQDDWELSSACAAPAPSKAL